MERAAFLIEATKERIGCLLNPSSVLVQREAGVSTRRSLVRSGATVGSDDPLLFTGGGRTELTLELLFDVSVAGSSIETEDVRALTQPLWQLSERAELRGGYARPPVVRFVWGKAWNVPGVIAAISEKVEHFTSGGVPRRSWVTLRLVRVQEEAPEDATAAPGVLTPPDSSTALDATGELELPTHQVTGAGGGGDAIPAAQRIDEIAARWYGDPSQWRLIAQLNDIDDPSHLPAGAVLRIPGRSVP